MTSETFIMFSLALLAVLFLSIFKNYYYSFFKKKIDSSIPSKEAYLSYIDNQPVYPILNAKELTNIESSRTLLLGEDYDRNTFHLYLKSGLIQFVKYDSDSNLINSFSGDSARFSDFLPKMTFSQTVDSDIYRISDDQRVILHLTPWDEECFENDLDHPMFGKTLEELTE